MRKVLKATPQTVHWGYFSPALSPVLEVADGERLEVETLSYPRGEQFPELLTPELEAIIASVTDIGPGPHLLTGPVHVEGAAPGDTLAIDIEAVEPLLGHAYNRIQPGGMGFGLLPEDFPEGRLTVLELDRARREVLVSDRVRVPMRCFFGIMGVAPDLDERWTSRIPGPFGGNLDVTELTAGATLYLPVFHDGALFSVGDGHATQGDGEVNLTAAEASLRGTLRLRVVRDMPIAAPHAETATHLITMGMDEDLHQAAKMAGRAMIAWVVRVHGLSRTDAYILCSLAMDLRISQVVNGRMGVHAMLAKSVFH
ncbi:acetamidase/formamidase family protein [Pelagibacterium lacus]|uniref:Acetamidase n=1 Tax=Pelagibacterium lacus TaxID=2282655 RepID=A0A369W0U1_9HYPH|nr:acetamidase/formamidase family protein [Pelagibacterium lacus]RDE08138.1 acetamidase [Pelagibacterium lacus]